MEKILPDTNFQFIRDKIYRLHTAIMYSMSNELIKIPNSIVNVVRIDDDGHLWFHCKAPLQSVPEYEKNFPVRLHFFRKGFNYFVEVSGGATIVKGQHNEYMIADKENERSLLIKMSINYAEFTDMQPQKKTRFDLIMENGYSWMIRNLTIPRTTRPLLARFLQGIKVNF
jgi:hypothetical protein